MMKKEIDYRKELIRATQAGDKERIKDIKDILAGTAVECNTFADFIIKVGAVPNSTKRPVFPDPGAAAEAMRMIEADPYDPNK